MLRAITALCALSFYEPVCRDVLANGCNRYSVFREEPSLHFCCFSISSGGISADAESDGSMASENLLHRGMQLPENQSDHAAKFARLRARAREKRVVPISELVFGALTHIVLSRLLDLPRLPALRASRTLLILRTGGVSARGRMLGALHELL